MMSWKPGETVLYTSESGYKSEKKIKTISTEGFVVLDFSDEEMVFSPSGLPLFDLYNELTSGPKIQKKPISDKKNNDPWANENLLKKLTIKELKTVLNLLVEEGYGNKPLDLSLHKRNKTVFNNVNKILNKKVVNNREKKTRTQYSKDT